MTIIPQHVERIPGRGSPQVSLLMCKTVSLDRMYTAMTSVVRFGSLHLGPLSNANRNSNCYLVCGAGKLGLYNHALATLQVLRRWFQVTFETHVHHVLLILGIGYRYPTLGPRAPLHFPRNLLPLVTVLMPTSAGSARQAVGAPRIVA